MMPPLQSRASPNQGLLITQERVVSIIRRILQVHGINKATERLEQLNAMFCDEPGWHETKLAIEDMFIAYNEEIKRQEELLRKMEIMQFANAFRNQSSDSHKQESSQTPEHPKKTYSDAHVKRCLEKLMKARTDKGKFIFNKQAHWQAVFRILSDKNMFRNDDFDGFDSYINRVMPANVNMRYTKPSVKNISQTPYAKPLDDWKYDPELMKKIRPFYSMQAVALCFKELLETTDE